MKILHTLSTLIPDEWRSAGATLREMFSEVNLARSWVKHLIGFLAVWSSGAIIGGLVWQGLYLQLVTGGVGGVDGWLKATMTMTSVLAGFMITLMLFTGKTEAWKTLSLEQAQLFSQKATYLLLSQFVTLLNHIIVIVTCVVWFLAAAQGRALETMPVVVALSGFLLVSLFRTLLVPLQIAELHRFALTAMLADKEDEIRKAIDAAKRIN